MSVEWVWAGAATPTSVWVRGKVTGSSTRLVVSEVEDLSNPVFFGPVSPTSEGVVSIEATGLEPDTRYWYALEDDGVVDTAFTGTFRTHPPLAEPASFVIGAAGDAGLPGAGDDSYITNRVSNNPVFDTMRAQALREEWLQFAHLGDLHYRDIATNDPDDYRQAYHDVLTFNGTLGADARQGRFYRSVPISYVWDDHDYGPNNSDRTHVGRAAAATVYREVVPHYPLPAGSGDAPIYQSWQIGRVLFLASDVRWARDPNTGLDDGTKTMLGADQKRWMERVLRNSNASALVWIMPSIWLSDQAGGDSSVDSWGRFRHEREELVDLFGDTGWLGRMVQLTADKHALSISSGPGNPWGGFPVFMFASMDSHHGTVPERQYDVGQSPGRQRYGTLRVVDSGHTIALHGTGYVNGRVWRSHTGYAHVEPRVLALDYARGQTFEPLEPTDDDQHLANDVTVQRRDGGEAQQEDITGPLGVNTVGRYSTSDTVNVRADDELDNQAGWRLHLGTVDEARYPTIAQHLTNTRMEPLQRDIAAQDVGDAITIANPPPWLPPEPIQAVVEGYDEELSTHDWRIEYNASPASIWRVGVAAPRLVLNSNHSFESGIHGWEGLNASLTHTREQARRGTGSMLQTPNGVSTVARAHTTVADSPRVFAGVEYTFSAWLMSPTGHDVDMTVQWFDEAGSQLGFPYIVPATPLPAGVWTLVSGSAVAPEGAYRLSWYINQRPLPAATDLLYIDEAIISDGSSPGMSRPNRLDTSGSLLVRDVDETSTELIVHSIQDAVLGARWINSEGPTVTHAHEFPFDLRLGGEVVRATGCEPGAWDEFRSARPAGSWGTTDSGQPWVDTTLPDTTLSTSTTDQYGAVMLTADPQFVRQQVLDLDFDAPDCEVLWTVRTNQTASGTALLPSLLMRQIGLNDYYRCRLHLNPNGTVSLSATRGVTQIGGTVNLPRLTYTPSAALDDRIMVRTRLIGHRILARAWAAANPEPTHWQLDVTVTIDTIDAGGFGFTASAFTGYTGTSPELRYQLLEVVTPQRLTVDRSVNRVVKSHDAGTPVSLAWPAVLGL